MWVKPTNDVNVWSGFASLQGIPLTDSADAAKKVSEEIIGESTNTFRTEIESVASMTPEFLTHLLQSAQEKPFLWNTLIDALQEKRGDPNPSRLILYAQEGYGPFDEVSESHRRAYLIALAERTNPDGTPGVGAEHAQNTLNEAAYLRRFGFTPDRGTLTSDL